VFLIIHAGLHLWFMGDPRYEFASTMSNLLIFSGALFGVLHLVSVYNEDRHLT
jgi:hypothetical protein